jgi:hypothetical protein
MPSDVFALDLHTVSARRFADSGHGSGADLSHGGAVFNAGIGARGRLVLLAGCFAVGYTGITDAELRTAMTSAVFIMWWARFATDPPRRLQTNFTLRSFGYTRQFKPGKFGRA